MNVATAGTPVAGDGEFQRTASTVDFDDLLHRAFAIRAFTHDDRSLVILQASRHNFTRTRGAGVHQNRDRHYIPPDVPYIPRQLKLVRLVYG